MDVITGFASQFIGFVSNHGQSLATIGSIVSGGTAIVLGYLQYLVGRRQLEAARKALEENRQRGEAGHEPRGVATPEPKLVRLATTDEILKLSLGAVAPRKSPTGILVECRIPSTDLPFRRASELGGYRSYWHPALVFGSGLMSLFSSVFLWVLLPAAALLIVRSVFSDESIASKFGTAALSLGVAALVL